jgi:hypothetical protein
MLNRGGAQVLDRLSQERKECKERGQAHRQPEVAPSRTRPIEDGRKDRGRDGQGSRPNDLDKSGLEALLSGAVSVGGLEKRRLRAAERLRRQGIGRFDGGFTGLPAMPRAAAFYFRSGPTPKQFLHVAV